ncbi:RIB43A-like with coiled-coils protein 1 [Tetrabaena socialis]|uniref:RIB43A-like with coiled-coils protein 1 n=1 Tax=Tetrabaena socialis TaxID=47790 RepID=A0A2J7ZZX2_9CHLO|nr:RIB43A-like with coiled-coils protein 1 [Tetrabaena socialis]|eukprot:PNH05806.1 RIB43A-like with coiled-coils protein 1 [Tetrabaena socialis]
MGRLVAAVPNEDPERLKRVLDAKWRTIGVDKETLDRQAQERRDAEQAAKDRDEAFARLTQYFNDQLSLMQQEADQVRAVYNHDTEAFRQQQQLKHTRREWDINRPDAKQLDMPSRVGDEDGRLGPASLQKFDGEDLTDPNMAASSLSAFRVRKDHYKGMTETEKQAILDAQLAQMEEKKARRAQEALENMMYARTQHDIQRALQEQSQRVDDFRKAQMARATDILKKQADEKQNRDKHLSTLYRNAIAPEFFTQFGTSHR